MKLLDLKALTEATEKVVALSVGDVRVRRLSRLEYISLLPPAPTGASTWTKEEAVEKELAWLESLSPTERVGRRAEMLEAMYGAIARAILEPVMTAEQVKRLGDDAYVIFQALQDFWKVEAVADGNGTAVEAVAV